MSLKKLYCDIYEQFVEKYGTAKGYDFQKSTLGSVAPNIVSFTEKLKWWTFDRPKRLTVITQERDRRQQEILALKNQSRPARPPAD